MTRARGWSYMSSSNVATGSMTTAGIAILQIAHDGLMRPRKFPSYKPSKQLQGSSGHPRWLRLGCRPTFGSMATPGRMAPNWHYYYLYGLERAAVLGDRDLLGEHDWYLLGARYLLDMQKAGGRWSTGTLGTKEYEASDVLDTAWAILFLKRATEPLPPVPAPAVTR